MLTPSRASPGMRRDMPDLVDDLLRQTRDRLKELKPLVQEYHRLVKADEALSAMDSGTSSTTARRPRSTTKTTSTTTTSRTRTAGIGQSIVAYFKDHPGATIAEAAASLKLDRANVSSNSYNLRTKGRLSTETLPGGSVGWRVAEEG